MPKGTAVTDPFDRTVTSGLGTTPGGLVWSAFTAGTVSASVSSGVASLSISTVGSFYAAYLPAFSESDVDVAVTGSSIKMATGGPIEVVNLLTRGRSTGGYYLFRAQINADNSVTVLIFDPAGNHLSELVVPGLTYSSGMQLRMRAQSIGRVHRLKLWQTTGTEPEAWQLSVVDDTYTGAGFIGLRAGVAINNTNSRPIVVNFSDFASMQVVDFTTDPLPIRVLAAFGADLTADWHSWVWTDITADVRQADGGTIAITPMGRGDEASQAQPAGCSFQLNNADKAYSAYNPASPHYPGVRRNTPIWVLVDPATRFFGYANGWAPSTNTAGKVPVVTVSASGTLRRLQQGKSPLKSPLTRQILAGDPIAHWPLEDGVDSTQAASSLPGGTPAVVQRGILDFTTDETPPGAAGSLQPSLDAQDQVVGVISGGSSTAWQMSVWCKGVFQNDPAGYVPLDVRTSTGLALRLTWDRAGDQMAPSILCFAATDADDALFATEYDSLPTDAEWHLMQVGFTQLGTDTVVNLFIDGIHSAGDTWPNCTIGAPVSMRSIGASEPGLITDGMSQINVSQIAFFNGSTLSLSQWTAGQAWVGEVDTVRLARLCAEENIPIEITGNSTTKMGPQGVDTLINLLRECEAANQGLLYDGRGPGLGFITREARYNTTASLTIDATAYQLAPPFAPVDDDQRNRNQVKADRKNGSSATYEDVDGPLGTDAIGVYDASLSGLNLVDDSPLLNYAAWAVHLGTVQGFRYPTLNLNLTGARELIPGWLGTLLSGRIDIAGVSDVADQLPAGDIGLLLEGYSESIAPFAWTVQGNCSPAETWNVTTLGVNFRLEMVGTTLAANLAPGSTTLYLTTATGHNPLTTTDAYPDDFPLYLNVGGWPVRVTAASGTNVAQTLTVDPTPNATTLPGGTTVTLWKPAGLAL